MCNMWMCMWMCMCMCIYIAMCMCMCFVVCVCVFHYANKYICIFNISWFSFPFKKFSVSPAPFFFKKKMKNFKFHYSNNFFHICYSSFWYLILETYFYKVYMRIIECQYNFPIKGLFLKNQYYMCVIVM